jgi:hypothetical protein
MQETGLDSTVLQYNPVTVFRKYVDETCDLLKVAQSLSSFQQRHCTLELVTGTVSVSLLDVCTPKQPCYYVIYATGRQSVYSTVRKYYAQRCSLH